MSNNAHDKAAQEEHFADIFARLREQDIEQFYAHYQLWVLRRRLPLIEQQLEALREHLAENQQVTESMRPSALALAVLVRLQSNGVNDTDVLDLMLERGEDWLDRMMQRLDYCEQVEDFIQGDYNQWCIKSLEGAYDWIDSLLGSIKEDKGRRENPERDGEAIEELLLQKLSQDGEETMLEVTHKQSVAPSETVTVGSEPFVAESLSASEFEQAISPDERTSTLDEKSELANQSELTLQAEETSEPSENCELEQQSELIGWKDLEDLEAPGGQPVPWYSIDVTEDGATSVPNGTTQATTMNDWITILHADTIVDAETHVTEASTDNTSEQLSTTKSAETAETHAPTSTPESETTEAANLSANPITIVEVQNEPEATFPVNTGQEESIPTSTELQNAETSGSESNIPVDETPVSESSLATEIALPTEKRTNEANTNAQLLTDESKLDPAEVTESGHDENKRSEIKVSAEKTAEVGQSTDESANHLEELKQAASEQEAASVDQPEAAQLLAEEGASTIDEADRTEIQRSFTADLIQTEAKTPEEAGEQSLATDLTQKTDMPTMAEVQSPGVNLTDTDAQALEITEAQSSVANLAPSENEAAELAEASIAIREAAEATRIQDDQTKNALPLTADMLLNANAAEEQPDRHEEDYARKTEKEAQSHEIAIAAIANDILGGEEEHEEQLAWYDYLDLEEPANSVENSSLEARIEAEKAGDASSGKQTVNGIAGSDSAEHVHVREDTNEQAALLRLESKLTEDIIESENWQNWSTSAADEETRPLALKEIQHAQYPAGNDTQAKSEVTEPRDELEDTVAEVHAPDPGIEHSSATAQTGRIESEPGVVAEETPTERNSKETQTGHPAIEINAREKAATLNSEQHLLSKVPDIAEQPTLMMDKIPQMPRGSAVSRASTENTGTGQIVHRENTPVSTQFTQPEKAEKPPKKLGFWRRLFRFGRKKKQ